MQALVDRVHSGLSASCSYYVPTVAPALTERSALLGGRGAAVGVAASRSSRSKGMVPPPPGQTRKNSAPPKGQPPRKPSPKPTKPQPSSNSEASAVRPLSGSSAQAAQSSKLPRPAGYVAPATPSVPIGTQLKAMTGGATSTAASASALTSKLTGGTTAPRASANAPVPKSAFNVPDREEDVDDDGFLDDGEASSGLQLSSEDGEDDTAEGGGDVEEDEEEAFPEIKFDLPNPSNVKVKTAEYLQSCVTVSDCPAPRFPEFAVIGRSNVGKSSIINMLTGRKDLALVSKQPGKTKCINHFLINGSWYLVDLPGYGFAKVGIQGRQQFDAFTREYFKSRPNLAMVFMLVDASIPPQKIDLEYANWLTDNEIPFALVFTKADKRRKGVPNTARDSNVTAFKRALLGDLAFLPPSILTSAAKGLGRGEMLNFIAGLRMAFEKSGRLAAIRQGML